jgi:hypothetical protein
MTSVDRAEVAVSRVVWVAIPPLYLLLPRTSSLFV